MLLHDVFLLNNRSNPSVQDYNNHVQIVFV